MPLPQPQRAPVPRPQGRAGQLRHPGREREPAPRALLPCPPLPLSPTSPLLDLTGPLNLGPLTPSQIVDQSHVQFSHHGVIGDRGEPAGHTAAVKGGLVTCAGGFDLELKGPGTRVPSIEFRPPSLSK
jgi:hypothetical protein